MAEELKAKAKVKAKVKVKVKVEIEVSRLVIWFLPSFLYVRKGSNGMQRSHKNASELRLLIKSISTIIQQNHMVAFG
jgi:hypothetical protein